MLRLCGDARPPLSVALSGNFVFPAPFQTGQLCSLEGISEAAGSHGIGFGGMTFWLTTHAPAAVMAESQIPWTVWTSDRLSIAVSRGCIEALRLWRNPDLFSQGVPLGLVTSRVVVMMDASTRGWGAVRGHAGFGAVVRTSEAGGT